MIEWKEYNNVDRCEGWAHRTKEKILEVQIKPIELEIITKGRGYSWRLIIFLATFEIKKEEYKLSEEEE